MSAARQTIMGRNPVRSPVKKLGLCGVCGEEVIAATLFPQRGTMVSRLHRGCVDSFHVFEGARVRGPHYGGA